MNISLNVTLRAFVYAVCAYGVAGAFLRFFRSTLAKANIRKRRDLLAKLGFTIDDKILVGLFHPYWYALLDQRKCCYEDR